MSSSKRERRITVLVAVEYRVDGDVEAATVAQQAVRLFPPMPEIGCPDWMASPIAVGLINESEAPW